MNIYVRPDKLGSAADKCSELENEIANIEGRFNRIVSSLDWKVKAQASVNRYVSHINSRFETTENTLKKHYIFLSDARFQYVEAENQHTRDSGELKNELMLKANAYAGDVQSQGTSKNGASEGKIPDYSGYIEGFLRNYMNQTYGDYTKQIREMGFLREATGMSVLGMFSDWYNGLKGLYDKYKNGVSSMADFIMNILKTGNKMFKSLFTTGYVIDDALKTLKGAELIPKGTKLFAKAGFAIVDTFLGFGIKGYESYQKYSADGKMTSTDWARVGIESSTKGLYNLGTAALAIFGGPIGVGTSVILSLADSSFGISDKIASDIEYKAQKVGEFIGSVKTKVSNAFNSYIKPNLKNVFSRLVPSFSW